MWLYLVIALPFLFLVGVIYNAIKAQRRLEERMQQFLEKRKAEGRELKGGFDDSEDDWAPPRTHQD